MKKYSGQAIAIIMIVLVVATVVGASLYSRMIQNSEEIVDTRESQRALEQADSILDAFISSDLAILQGKIKGIIPSSGEDVLYTNINDLKTQFFDVDPVIDTKILDGIEWCDEATEANSEIEITIGYADENSPIEYNVGDVMAINLADVSTIPVGCEINLLLTARGNGDHLFTLKYVYMDKASGDVVPYKLDDMLLYCLTTGTPAECGDDIDPSVAPGSSIYGRLGSNSNLNIPYATLSTPNLYEIRLLPLKEKIGVAVLPNNCGDVFSNFKVNAKVNCKGDVREKQVVIPSVNNMGYSALFDYTIYNANGTLSPN